MTWGLVVALCLAPGCSMFVGSTQPVNVVASDPAATIWVDGVEHGTGSVSGLQLQRNEDHSLMATLGERVATRQIGHKLSPTGIADCIGGCIFLLPFLGALAPGFWSLEQTTVNLVLSAGDASQ